MSSPTPQFKSINSLALSFFYGPTHIPYMTTGENIALTRWNFVGKITSLLNNTLSRLVRTFLPRNKCLLITWLQSQSAVILELPKIKFLTVSIVSPSIFHEVIEIRKPSSVINAKKSRKTTQWERVEIS